MATTSKGFYYPINSDAPDIPTHIQTLATGIDTYFDNKANLASPTFTGTPAAPTAAADTNTTQVATTAYVVGQGYAKLASPNFSGTITHSGAILFSGGVVYNYQPTPTAKTTTAVTLTTAELLTGIITSTQTAATTFTLPTGTLMDSGVSASIANNESFDWSIINLGSTSGAVTVAVATAHTVVGNMSVAISTSATFRSRRTAAATWVTYRIS